MKPHNPTAAINSAISDARGHPRVPNATQNPRTFDSNFDASNRPTEQTQTRDATATNSTITHKFVPSAPSPAPDALQKANCQGDGRPEFEPENFFECEKSMYALQRFLCYALCWLYRVRTVHVLGQGKHAFRYTHRTYRTHTRTQTHTHTHTTHNTTQHNITQHKTNNTITHTTQHINTHAHVYSPIGEAGAGASVAGRGTLHTQHNTRSTSR